jgi:alkylation response protein AidB-like acyl-CoA dehydrogenase
MTTVTPTTRDHLLTLVDEVGPAFTERAPQLDRDAAFPFENFADLRRVGLLGACIPAEHGGLGASFQDYMHLSAHLASYCPVTALTFNMHCQTILWTGVVADELEMSEAERARHEEIRAELYRTVLEDGAIMSQPLSEGIAKGATQGIATIAKRVDGGFLVSGRKIFASLAGAASAYNITCQEPDGDEVLFLSVKADNPGVTIVGDWDTLGMRATDSRTLVFEDAFVPDEHQLLQPGIYEQLAERWPWVYMTLTPTYVGLTRAVTRFVQTYLAGDGSPASNSRRDVPAKQMGWAEIQIAAEQSEAIWETAVARAGVDPSPEDLRRAWAACFTVMENAPAVASKAIRVCGGSSIMRKLALEQHYRDARCGSLMLPWSADVCVERLGRYGLFGDGQ